MVFPLESSVRKIVELSKSRLVFVMVSPAPNAAHRIERNPAETLGFFAGPI